MKFRLCFILLIAATNWVFEILEGCDTSYTFPLRSGWGIRMGDRSIPPEGSWLCEIWRWREPVPTRVLNSNASKASYKPRQRSYRKTWGGGNFRRGGYLEPARAPESGPKVVLLLDLDILYIWCSMLINRWTLSLIFKLNLYWSFCVPYNLSYRSIHPTQYLIITRYSCRDRIPTKKKLHE